MNEEDKQDNVTTVATNTSSTAGVTWSSGTDSGTYSVPPSENPKGYVTEESYQGLQRVVAKRDKELGEMKQKLEEAIASLEEMKSGSSSLSEEKQKLEKSVTDAQSALQNLEKERTSLSKQLEQQTVIMTEFPDLAPMSVYIPQADTADTYRENAKKFKEALEDYVNAGVKKKLSGSTPPAPTDGKETISEEEIDRLWKDVYRLAGVPGKEKEYLEANSLLQRKLTSQNTG